MADGQYVIKSTLPDLAVTSMPNYAFLVHAQVGVSDGELY